MMIEKISVVAPTTAVPISTGLAVALNVFPAPSFFSSRSLECSKSTLMPLSRLSCSPDAGNRFDQAQFVNALGVVGDRAVAIDGDRDRSHAQESEGDQAKGEDRDGRAAPGLSSDTTPPAPPNVANAVGDRHQTGDDAAHPERGEIAGDEAAEDVQRRTALAAGIDDFAHVAAVNAGENLGEFGDQRPGQRAAGDDRGQLPPQPAAEIVDQRVRAQIGCRDRDEAGDVDEAGERFFEIHFAWRSGKACEPATR